MVISKYKKYGIKECHIWFCKNDDIFENTKDDIIFFHGLNRNPQGNNIIIYNQNTLIKNLGISNNDLYNSFGKHLRSYIARSKREGTLCKLFCGREIVEDKELLLKCEKLYEKMYTEKGINKKFNRKLFYSLAFNNKLLVGIAIVCGEIVGFDAVIFDEHYARLWMAAFDFRSSSNDSQILSRAHQQLDWVILQYFNNLNYLQFDFGGISSYDKPNGIDKFKLSFEKDNHVTYLNCVKGVSFKGRIIVKIMKLMSHKGL